MGVAEINLCFESTIALFLCPAILFCYITIFISSLVLDIT